MWKSTDIRLPAYCQPIGMKSHTSKSYKTTTELRNLFFSLNETSGFTLNKCTSIIILLYSPARFPLEIALNDFCERKTKKEEKTTDENKMKSFWRKMKKKKNQKQVQSNYKLIVCAYRIPNAAYIKIANRETGLFFRLIFHLFVFRAQNMCSTWNLKSMKCVHWKLSIFWNWETKRNET